jgi:Preprotein translocase subunit SecB.
MKIDLKSPPSCVLDDFSFNAFQVVQKKDDNKDDSLDVSCLLYPHKEDDERYQIRITLDYRGKAKTSFALQIIANGYFRWRGGLESGKGVGYMAWVNGGTILYGLTRATVAELTSSCECGRVILPTIMMDDLVKTTIQEREKNSKLARPDDA